MTLTFKNKQNLYALSKIDLDKVLKDACFVSNGNLIVEILNDLVLKEKLEIDENENKVLIFACKLEANNIVKLLLSSPLLKQHANIHTNNEEPLKTACEYYNMELVHYLLTSPELKTHANLYTNDGQIFIDVCEEITNEEEKRKNKENLINYLVFDYEIKLTNKILNYLENNNELKKKISSRDLSKKLMNEMTSLNIKSAKKEKI